MDAGFVQTSFAMNPFAIRFCVFVFVGTLLCSPAAVLESVQAQEPRGYNLFDTRRNEGKDTPRIQRPPVDAEVARRFQEIRNATDPEQRGSRQSALYYALFLLGVAAVAAGLFGWKAWQKRREAWAVNDPMALVKELNHVHQLNEQEKRVMRELSEQNVMPTSLSLFVEPKFLLEALENEAFAPSRSTVRRLLSKLFDIAAEGGEASSILSSSNLSSV